MRTGLVGALALVISFTGAFALAEGASDQAPPQQTPGPVAPTPNGPTASNDWAAGGPRCTGTDCAGLVVTNAVLHMLDHKTKSEAPPRLNIVCNNAVENSAIPVGCPTMRVSWHNMFAGPTQRQNVSGAHSEIELDSKTAKYGVEVSTIDGKWSKKFLNARAGDTIEISYKAKSE